MGVNPVSFTASGRIWINAPPKSEPAEKLTRTSNISFSQDSFALIKKIPISETKLTKSTDNNV